MTCRMIQGLLVWSAVLLLVVAPAAAQDDPFSSFGLGVALVKTPVAVPASEFPNAVVSLPIAPSFIDSDPPLEPRLECTLIAERAEKPVKRVRGTATARFFAVVVPGEQISPPTVPPMDCRFEVARWKTDRFGRTNFALRGCDFFDTSLIGEAESREVEAVIVIEAKPMKAKPLNALTLECLLGADAC